MTPQKRADIDALRGALERADWGYEYCDDYSQYCIGKKSVEIVYLLVAMMRERYGKDDADLKGLLARYKREI